MWYGCVMRVNVVYYVIVLGNVWYSGVLCVWAM